VLARGEQLYAKNCAICHGDQGDGAGKFAYLMNPRPRNLQQGQFKLSTTENQIPTDEDLLRTISFGMPGSSMPPWGHLPQSDLEALVKHVRKLNVDATGAMLRTWIADGVLAEEELDQTLAQRTEPGPTLVMPPEPGFDEVRWFHGRKLYLENCASCHGVDGEPVADAVQFDTEGYPVPPRSFVNGIFKGSSQGHQLYARIWKGMRGTPMPGSQGVYSPDEVWTLVHYVQSLARTGAQERAQLRQSTIVAPQVVGSLPQGPMDEAWDKTRPVYVGLTPLWWTDYRIEGLLVQAMHNGEELALRLSWLDPTKDDRAVRQSEFRDAVAIQFSLTSDPPFYMGDPTKHGGVNIWMWKADRQTDIVAGHQGVDEAFPDRAVDQYPEQDFTIPGDRFVSTWPMAPITQHDPQFVTAWGAGNLVADPTLTTPVECLTARGPGTLSGKPPDVQFIQGSAVWERGVWTVQLQRTLELPCDQHQEGGEERVFSRGDYLPVSFAVWDGHAGDRDGKKNFSIWQKLIIE
jgi:DMSO reductase family type II enzyme heme b subunit